MELFIGDVPQGVPGLHDDPGWSRCLQVSVLRKAQLPSRVQPTFILKGASIRLPGSLVERDDLRESLPGPQMLLCEQPQRVVPLHDDSRQLGGGRLFGLRDPIASR